MTLRILLPAILLSLEQLLPKSGPNPAVLGFVCKYRWSSFHPITLGNIPGLTTAPILTHRGKEAVKILSCKVLHSSICCCVTLIGLRGVVETLREAVVDLNLEIAVTLQLDCTTLSPTSFSFDLPVDVMYIAAGSVISLWYYFCN